jgi:hypothetical protein
MWSDNYKYLTSRIQQPKHIEFKAPLIKHNVTISIQFHTISESGASPHEPQSTLIETKSGDFHTSP